MNKVTEHRTGRSSLGSHAEGWCGDSLHWQGQVRTVDTLKNSQSGFAEKRRHRLDREAEIMYSACRKTGDGIAATRNSVCRDRAEKSLGTKGQGCGIRERWRLEGEQDTAHTGCKTWVVSCGHYTHNVAYTHNGHREPLWIQ